MFNIKNFLLNIPKYQLYLLQLENYELGRYLKLLFKRGVLPKGNERKSLVWTIKVRAIFFCAFITHLIALIVWLLWISAFAGMTVKIILSFIVYYTLLYVYFIFYIFCLLLLWPADFVFKQWIIFKAKSKILDLKSKIKIVAISGSYGKTTIKEVLKSVLRAKYKVLSTEESVNTPIGIARWILKEVSDETEILIVEMGEHYRGDIKELCKITPPEVGVITGVNEAHLERMGSMENTLQTILELAQNLKPNGLLVYNGDDQILRKGVDDIKQKNFNIATFSQFNNILDEDLVTHDINFNEQELFWEFVNNFVGFGKIHLLGRYGVAYALVGIILGKHFGLTKEEVRQGIEKIRPVTHRLNPGMTLNDVLVIDDAYNGNSEGAKEAIEVLKRFKERRKIYITPGLVETGAKSKETHLEIGRQLANGIDVVILIKNSVSSWIEEGIRNQELGIRNKEKLTTYNLPTIFWFNTAQEAHKELKNILKPGDVIVFQNDWGDQYM